MTAIPRRARAARKSIPAFTERLLAIASRSLDDDKAEDVVVIDLHGKSSIADAMVIATGRSHRQVGAMAQHLTQRLEAAGVRPVRVEGERYCDWVLIDAGDVIVHLFRPEVRRFYNLEKMWRMAPPAAEHTLAVV